MRVLFIFSPGWKLVNIFNEWVSNLSFPQEILLYYFFIIASNI